MGVDGRGGDPRIASRDPLPSALSNFTCRPGPRWPDLESSPGGTGDMRKSGRLITVVLASASIAGVALIAAVGESPAAATPVTVTFTASPNNSTGGIAFSRQPVVTLSGPGATATALVTLSVNTGPGALT